MKLGILFEKMGTTRAVIQALPPGGSYDHRKLALMLSSAETGKPIAKKSKPLANYSSPDFEFTRTKILKDKKKLITYLANNQKEYGTHRRVLDEIKTNVGAQKMLDPYYYGDILNQVYPAELEAFFARLPYQKRNQLKHEIRISIQGKFLMTRCPRLYNIARKSLNR